MSQEEFHHRNAMTKERSTHQRPVASLMHVRSVFEHPLRDGQPLCTWRLPWDATFGDPGERAVFVIAERSAMQRRIMRHEGFDARGVVGIDGLLELSDHFERIDVGFQSWPARKSIETCNFELRLGERCGAAGSEQILGLILQMAEVGTIGERTRCVLRTGRHCDLLSLHRPLSAFGLKEGLQISTAKRWASALSADRMRPLRCKNPSTSNSLFKQGRGWDRR